MQGHSFIAELSSKGRYYFTSQEAEKALGVSSIAARAVLRRLKAKGEIASPIRGFYVIVAPEYRSLGCLPPDQFVPDLMRYLNEPYYVGLLSAAQYYGAAHQQPQQFQVIVSKNRPPIRCGKTKVIFVARKNVNDVPVRKFNTAKGIINVATPEVVAMDLVTYPQHSGGYNNIVTVLEELVEEMDAAGLAKIASCSKEIPWIQRLGYLLTHIGANKLAAPLAVILKSKKIKTVPLAVGYPTHRKSYDHDWHISVNFEIESDQ